MARTLNGGRTPTTENDNPAVLVVNDYGGGDVTATAENWPDGRMPDQFTRVYNSGFRDRGAVVSHWSSRREFVWPA